MRRRAPALLSFIVVGSMTPCGLRSQTADEESPMTTPDLPAFLETLDALREHHRIPGMSVAVVVDGEVVLAAGLGYADPATGRRATADTPYDAASVSKPISAVVALRLEGDGVVELDRPIATYSDWADFCTAFSEQPSIFAEGLVCDPPVHTLRHLLSHTAVGRPGAAFSYNPVLYSWASRPIRAAAGTPFSDLVVREVFAPAGMERSARRHRDLPLPRELAADLAPPHRVDDDGALVPAPPPPPQGDGAAGGVVTTVLDLASFDVALDGGVLLAPEDRERMMERTQSTDGEPLPYGIGWFVEDFDGTRLVWHSGWWEDAYSALYLKVPSRGVTFIALANAEGLWWDNALDRAEVHRSPFARAFLHAFVDPDAASPAR